jgi:hypothetical protein
MAMNKAEKARVAELEAALAAATINAPSYDEPNPMTREEIDAAKIVVTPRDRSYHTSRRVALGYGFNDYGIGRVFPMWSDGHCHGRDNHTGDSASQNMGRMYRTKREAAIALRLALAKRCGEILAAADRLIKERDDG